MAFLLLLHEKMRLKRQINKLTLKQVRNSSRLDRLTKNIEKKHKMYNMRETWIDKQAQIMQSQAATIFQNMWGLGTMNQTFNPGNYGGVTSFVFNQAFAMFTNKQGLPIGDKDSKGNPKLVSFSEAQFTDLSNEYAAGTLKQSYDDKNQIIKGKYGSKGQFSEQEFNAFMMCMRQAQQNQSVAQMSCQQMTQQYQQGISVWVDAQKAQLQAEEDSIMAPLEMKQTEMDLEKESIEMQLTSMRERYQNISEACKTEIKDSAPKFGLG